MANLRILNLALSAALLGLLLVPAGGIAQVAPSAPVQRQRSEHLSHWMEVRANLRLPEMLDALEREPDFQKFPAAMQQRLRDQLVARYKKNGFPHVPKPA